METEEYYVVEIACNGYQLATRDTYQEALQIIREYEADDTSDFTYEPGYYAIRHGNDYERIY